MTSSSSRLGSLPDRLLFVAAIFASAFLIFLVQPIVGKRILPWFGGTSAVWTLCLAFYQTMLFVGYAYAHCLIRFASPGLQLGVHAGAVGIAILALPVLPGEAWQPRAGADPSGRILMMLAANVALPFLVLASTGPLVQAWFARRHRGRSPYPLYAVSNLGSLAALVLYPFAIEPRFGLSETGDFWSWAFLAAACAVLGCAALAWRSPVDSSAAEADREAGSLPSRSRTAFWFLLPACAVVLLMGVTNELTIDIASVPFLWILPLATYLVTFVVSFSSESAYRRAPIVILGLLAAVPSVGLRVWSAWVPAAESNFLWSPPVQIPSYCVLLFALCMILHGELYRLRPPPERLTVFYMLVSAGGAFGGIFVGIVAPRIFGDHYEIGIALGLASGLFLVLCANDPKSMLHRSAPRWRWVGVGSAVLVVLGYSGWTLTRSNAALVHQERSFFGVHRIFEGNVKGTIQRSLWNGSTVHGLQIMDKGRRLPTSYYGRATGLGLVMQSRGAAAIRVGVIGLGVGTLATYARVGDVIRFYEIDPVVVRLAHDERYFHFLEDSHAEVEIVVGDARLSIADEQARGVSQSFDYLIIDAFNSDAVPVHLLTREAFARYVASLAPGGLLAVHSSSRNFDLMPLVARVGSELGLHDLQIVNERAAQFQSKPSQWVWLSHDRAVLEALADRVLRQHVALGLEPGALRLSHSEASERSRVPIWTDDYSDLFGILRRR